MLNTAGEDCKTWARNWGVLNQQEPFIDNFGNYYYPQ